MESSDSMKLLLVEDDVGIGRVVRKGLANHGISVEWLRTGGPSIGALRSGRYDAVVLDLMLPDMDGFDLCRDIRALGNTIPICMLTARDALEDKLEGFEVGADDYLTKPFEIDELVARLRALVRRNQRDQEFTSVKYGNVMINLLSREVTVDDQPVELTRREFDVLACLAKNAQQVVSREKLLQIAWATEREVTLNSADVYIGYLRRKLGEFPNTPQIKTVRGIGFKLS